MRRSWHVFMCVNRRLVKNGYLHIVSNGESLGGKWRVTTSDTSRSSEPKGRFELIENWRCIDEDLWSRNVIYPGFNAHNSLNGCCSSRRKIPLKRDPPDVRSGF
jgi:hypothetical protein